MVKWMVLRIRVVACGVPMLASGPFMSRQLAISSLRDRLGYLIAVQCSLAELDFDAAPPTF